MGETKTTETSKSETSTKTDWTGDTVKGPAGDDVQETTTTTEATTTDSDDSDE